MSKEDDIQGKRPDNTITEYTPPWMQNIGSKVIPQGMPGQLSMLAGDLAAGGFGTKIENMKALDNIYDPVQVPNFSATAKKPGTPNKPKPTAVTPGVITDPNQMIWINGEQKPAWMTSHIKTTGRPKGR